MDRDVLSTHLELEGQVTLNNIFATGISPCELGPFGRCLLIFFIFGDRSNYKIFATTATWETISKIRQKIPDFVSPSPYFGGWVA